MTIITKSSQEKKNDKLILPLVDNEVVAPSAPADAESLNPNFVILRARARRISATTTLCLLLTSLIVVGIGIVCGKILYDQYISAQMRKFHGVAQIPIDDINSALMKSSSYYNNDGSDNQVDSTDNLDGIIRNYFREKFEINMDSDENYENIYVPDFQSGRKGRFIHDFNTNMTGIVDETGNRCFVMPLNRVNILPPKSLFDLIHKMWDGYYKVDTKVIRQSMRVVTPPLKDLNGVGAYIATECNGRPVYKLEKYVEGVVKRSIQKEIKFIEFSGKGILELDIVNLGEVEEYEKQSSVK